MKKIIPDLLLIAGAGLVSYGAWLVYEPSGFAVAGVLALWFGIMLSRVK